MKKMKSLFSNLKSIIMKWFIATQHNMLLDEYDKICTEFIEGKISKDLFDALKIEYLKRKDLFVVNLN